MARTFPSVNIRHHSEVIKVFSFASQGLIKSLLYLAQTYSYVQAGKKMVQRLRHFIFFFFLTLTFTNHILVVKFSARYSGKYKKISNTYFYLLDLLLIYALTFLYSSPVFPFPLFLSRFINKRQLPKMQGK